mmetsp:Transcript_21369/g.44833  ORF Transcript_21369/g.44833 Transcript_21369/m.44833 type:complete len:170 (-) Transcript_21369:372-881(-)
MQSKLILLLTAIASTPAIAFVAPAPRHLTPKLILSAADTEAEIEEPKMNPDNPALPELKGDYDWDAAHAADPDWITENVPGKIVLNEVELAAQVTELSKLEEMWRKERLNEEYEEARIIGWVDQAETYNGRFAMFFLAVGLLTEYWTGIDIPGQIEEMARVGGFIGPDY